jgi:hypothetical protein
MADYFIPRGARGAPALLSARGLWCGGYYVACLVISSYKRGQEVSQVFQKPPFNYQYLVGLANSIDFESAPVTQNGVVVQAPLQDLIIPHNVFAQDGQKLIVGGYGRLTTPTVLGQVSVTINGSQVAVSNSAPSATQFAWKYDLELLRQGADLLVYASSQMGIAITTSTFTVSPPNLSFTVLPAFNFAQDAIILFLATLNNAGHTLTQLFSWAGIQ